MGQLFAYSLSVSLVMIPLYLTVRYAMRGLTFHRLHRAMLLGVVVLSLLVPLAVPLLRPHHSAPGVDGIFSVSVVGDAVGAVAAATDRVAPVGARAAGVVSLVFSALLIIYLAGVLTTLAYRLRALLSLIRFVRSCEVAGEFNGLTVRVHDNSEINPFSWGGSIVVSRRDLDDCDLTVMMHEAAHLERRHWIDLLAINLLTPLLWYNPVAWMIGRDLAIVHEYQADNAVIEGGANPRAYQIMLVRRAAGSSFGLVVNSLGHAEISKRVRMMLRSKSKPADRLRAAFAVPVVIASALALSVPGVSETISRIGTTGLSVLTVKPNSVRPPEKVHEIPLMIPEDDTTPDAPADEQTIETNDLNSESEIASATVKATGEVPAPATETPADVRPQSATDPADATVRTEEEAPQSSAEGFPGKKQVFDAVETPPQYPGDTKALLEFVAMNVNYPPEAAMQGIQGKVIVKCVVNEQGEVADVIVLRSKHPLLDEEAARVVKMLKFETPGMQNGVPVSVYYTIPVTFKLQN